MDSKNCRPILKKVKHINYNNPSLNSSGMGGVFFDGKLPSLLRDQLRYNQYPQALQQHVKQVEHEKVQQQRQSRESMPSYEQRESEPRNYRPNQMSPVPFSQPSSRPPPAHDYQPIHRKRELVEKVTSSNGNMDTTLNRDFNFNDAAIRHKQMVGYNIISNT